MVIVTTILTNFYWWWVYDGRFLRNHCLFNGLVQLFLLLEDWTDAQSLALVVVVLMISLVLMVLKTFSTRCCILSMIVRSVSIVICLTWIKLWLYISSILYDIFSRWLWILINFVLCAYISSCHSDIFDTSFDWLLLFTLLATTRLLLFDFSIFAL